MADFSKQWADVYDSEFPWDFDIEEEAESIPKGYYKSIICEGFGFTGIGVGMDGKIYLLFPEGDDAIRKVDYEPFLKKQKLTSQGI